MKHPFRLIDLTTFKKVSSLFSGNYKTSFHGSGMEFADIREYNFGDNASDIDWKTTAKTGKTYIKKYEEDRERKVLFLVDIGKSMRFGSRKKTKEDSLKEAFFLLLFSSAYNNDPSGVWFFHDHIEKIYKVEKGINHVQKIYKDFENIISTERTKESSLSGVFQELCQKRIKNHLIFIFSDSVEQMNEVYFRSITAQNDCVFVHIFDSFENTLAGADKHILQSGINIFLDTMNETKRRQYILERTALLKDFRHTITNLGGSYLALDESKNIYKELFLFFKKRQNAGL